MPCLAIRAAAVCAEWGGEQLAELAPGDSFELLELAGDHAWGTARAVGLVGYCDRAALKLA